MNDAIAQHIEQFVQEILSLIRRENGAGRAGALRPARQSSRRKPPTTRTGGRSRTAAPSPKRSQAPQRGPGRAASEATAPAVVVPSRSASTDTNRPASKPTGASSPAPDREALVLDAVRSLGRATASEVAGHTGLPNGSAAVALRSLVTRSLIKRIETQRGVEYGFVSPGSARPSKRSKVAAT